jgi:tellurite resistance protein
MGLTGLTIATQKTVEIFHLNMTIPFALLCVSLTIFCLISTAMLLKLFFYKDDIVKDFLHPVKISFFPTFSISLLLIAIALLPINTSLSRATWELGVIAHFVLTLFVISFWIRQDHYKIEHLNPAWFIPVVGNLLIPVAGVSFVNSEMLWFFFSIGIIFWLILMTIVIYRLFFHEPLAGKMMPTLFILMAPPAVGVISYFKLTHQIDSFSRVLYYFALFIALLLVSNVRMFINKKFYLSEWAFTFPLAAVSIASALMFHQTKYKPMLHAHILFLAFEAFIVALLVYRTVKAMYLHEICLDE